MTNILIGTAGHIDHGKSSLVKALTGYESDRLPEEKKRGISIELGFTPLVLPSGKAIGLVDVPGHEKFIKTMLTGVSGIDAVLFLIAANEGIMPQTEEHLDILELLDIKKGIIVLSKCDLLNEEELGTLETTVRAFLKKSFLKEAPLVKTSACTGAGLPELLNHLELLVDGLSCRSNKTGVRLPIDRGFSLAGQGTIVTGTLWGGEINKNDTLELIGAGKAISVRVRNIQVHGQDQLRAEAGQRVALNIPGIEKTSSLRGAWLARKGLLTLSYRLDIKLTVLPSAAKILHGQRVHLHHAAKETVATVRLLDKEEALGGETCYCQVFLHDGVAALEGDKVILRFYSPTQTIAGGVVLASAPPRHHRYQESVINQLSGKDSDDPLRYIHSILEESAPLTFQELSEKSMVPPNQLQKSLNLLVENKTLTLLSVNKTDYYLSHKTHQYYLTAGLTAITTYHKDFPLRSGIPLEELRQKTAPNQPRAFFQQLMISWQTNGTVILKTGKVRLPGFTQNPQPGELAWRSALESSYQRELFSPPSWQEAALTAGIPLREQKEILLWLTEDDCLVRVNNDIFFHKQAIEIGLARLGHFKETAVGFSLADAKNILQTSRKYAVALLEYFDEKKITQRVGDLRYFIK